MAYYDDRPYYTPRDRRDRQPGTAADYFDDHPDQPRAAPSRFEREIYPGESVEEIQRHFPPGEDYMYERGYNSRRSGRPVYETVRRASSVGGYDPYYDERPRRSGGRSRRYDDRRK